MTMLLLREHIGQSLRSARTSQARTLRDVAREARVSLGYLSEVERGQKEASSELLNAICQALAARGKTPKDASLAEMDSLWDEAKASEKAAP